MPKKPSSVDYAPGLCPRHGLALLADGACLDCEEERLNALLYRVGPRRAAEMEQGSGFTIEWLVLH